MRGIAVIAFIAIMITAALFTGCAKEQVSPVNTSNGSAINITAQPTGPSGPIFNVTATNSSNTTERTTNRSASPNTSNTTINVTKEENKTKDKPEEKPVANLTKPIEQVPPPVGSSGTVQKRCGEALISRCGGPPSLDCVGAPTLDIGTKTVTFTVKNNLAYPITLKDVYMYNDEEPWSCMTRSQVMGAQISVEGSSFSDIASAPIVASGQGFEISIALSNLDQDYIDQGFEISYSGESQDRTGYFKVTASSN
jgi:hypothetical protein